MKYPDHLPRTVLGFDFGTKRIGVAAGQAVTGTASPLLPLSADNGQPAWSEVGQLIDEWKPDAVVVGVPTNMDGSLQFITARAIKFAKRIHGRFGISVYGQDERLSTYAALERSARYGVDSDAAAIIVENWLRAAKSHLSTRL